MRASECDHQEVEKSMAEEKNKNSHLAIKLEHSKGELTNYCTREEEHWIEKNKVFLESPEFYDLLRDCFSFLIKHGFRGDCSIVQRD